MARHNGWKRLWVLLSGSYLLVVVIVAVSSFPSPSDVPSTEILRQLSDQSLQLMANGKKKWNTTVEDGINIPVPLELDQATTLTFKADYKNAVGAAAQKNRLWHILMALLWWLVPSMLLYAFGSGIAWVRRGFSCDVP